MSLEEQIIGPYRLLKLLGEGGMGVVYCAEHRETGKRVALKTVKVPNEALLRSIRREIHALARLRHPSIVLILEEGLHQGLPWYAMELLEGQTLRSWRRSLDRESRDAALLGEDSTQLASCWWTHTLNLPPPATLLNLAASEGATRASLSQDTLLSLLTVLHRLCAGLSFLHGEGILHHDIKPDNILVIKAGNREWAIGNREEALRAGEGGALQEGQTAGIDTGSSPLPIAHCPLPVLVDFGLASPSLGGESSRERLVLEAGLSGTVYYISPEQIRGEPLDARSDLYSLGVILFELLTGERPFTGKDAWAVLQAHLVEPPPLPSERVDGVPPELDALVLRLLAKERRRRPGYAEDVARALGELGVEEDQAPPKRGRSYLYRPVLSGREGPLRRLSGALSRVGRGQGGLLLLGGESGVGKTRLAMEAAREAAKKRIRVLLGECQDTKTRAALCAFRKPLQAISDHCRERGRDVTEQLLGRHSKILCLYEPSLSSLPGQALYPAPEELPAEAARERLFSSLGAALLAFSGEEPLFLALDDLQWADELSLGFLRFFSQERPPQSRLLILGTYRSEELSAGLSALLEEPGVEGLSLGRLEEKAVARMVGDMLALSPPPMLFSRYLTKHSEGNPFFVAEYLRAAVEEGILWRNREGRWQVSEQGGDEVSTADYEQLPLPRSLRELLGRRLAGLSSEAKGVVEAAATLGRETSLSLLEKMLRIEEDDFLAALVELLGRQVLEESEPGRVRFVHDKLRETAYERLGQEARPRLHRAAALGIEALYGAAREAQLASLGHHWEEAGEDERACACYLSAARSAARIFAHDEAERLYRAFLRLVGGPSEESVKARNELGEDLLQGQGRMEEARAMHEEALREAREIQARRGEAESLRNLGVIAQRMGRIEEGQALLERALSIHREVKDRPGEGVTLGTLAALHLDQARMEEGRALLEEALALHRALGNRRAEGTMLNLLALLHQEKGFCEEARALFAQALAIHREVKNRRSEGITLGNLAVLGHEQGRFEEALTFYKEALALHQEVKNRRSEGNLLHGLALLHWEQGFCEEAREVSAEALSIHRQIKNRRGEGVILSSLAMLRFEQGFCEEAREVFAEALAIHREVGNRRAEGITLGDLANLARLCADDLSEAKALCQEGERLLRRVGDKMEIGLFFCIRGHLAIAQGQSASDLLERAAALAKGVSAGPQSKLGKAISRLRRAEETFARGETERLYRGEIFEDLLEGVKRWLEERRR